MTIPDRSLRCDSLGRKIEKHGSHHCRFVDDADPGTPLSEVLEFEVSVDLATTVATKLNSFTRRFDLEDD
jgi:hypothetical protein